MVNLKDYINESILDDFEDLSNTQHKELEHPWGIFWKNIALKHKNWNSEIKRLEQIISIGAKKLNSMQPNVDKGIVYVAFWTPTLSSKQNIYIKCNKSDYDELIIKGFFNGYKGRKPIGISKPNIAISQTFHGFPRISFGNSAMIPGIPSLINSSYLLSKEQSKHVFEMIDKMSNNDEWLIYINSL
jgi:hypothetical protein